MCATAPQQRLQASLLFLCQLEVCVGSHAAHLDRSLQVCASDARGAFLGLYSEAVVGAGGLLGAQVNRDSSD